MSKNPQFDIVIPVHKKDLAVLEYCIEAARKKIVGVRRIITISKERYTNNAEWFAESQFPFDMEFVRNYTGGSCGWYLQQLLKLYAPLVIPDIAKNVLILDSDTVFFRKVKMFDAKNRPFYNIGKDKNIHLQPFVLAVAKHIDSLWPALSRKNLPARFQNISGICHNMMFNRQMLEELFKKVEDYDGSGDKFYKIFLKHADHGHSASEYQIYFNFLLIFHADKISLRRLKYKNTADLDIKKYRKRLKYHYCSFHSYMRNKGAASWRFKFGDFFKNIYKKIFEIEVRNIGIANCNIAEFLNIPNQKIKWLKSPNLRESRITPFGLIEGNAKFIFFEKYEKAKKKGKISVLKLAENLDIVGEESILEEKNHLSYPYIFQHLQKKYALITSREARELALYEVLDNSQFKKIKIILSDLDIINPSIIFHENKFWIFFSQASEGAAKLYIAYCDELFGEWKMHENNPIKQDLSSSFSAGEIFLHQGNLFRPVQKCAKNATIKINKIVKLTSKEFAEIEEIEIAANQLGHYPQGLGHISSLGENYTLIEGKKKIFAPHKSIIYLARIFVKNTKNLHQY